LTSDQSYLADLEARSAGLIPATKSRRAGEALLGTSVMAEPTSAESGAGLRDQNNARPEPGHHRIPLTKGRRDKTAHQAIIRCRTNPDAHQLVS